MSPYNTDTGKSAEALASLMEGEGHGGQGGGDGGGDQGKCRPSAEGKPMCWEPSEAAGTSKGALVSTLVGELLCDIYGKTEVKRRSSTTSACDLSWQDSDRSRSTSSNEVHGSLQWMSKDVNSLRLEKAKLEKLIAEEGTQLVKYLKRKNILLMKREAHYDIITAYIQAISPKTREDTKMKFSLSPCAETGFSQWLDAMKMVAQLPGGMPTEFRMKLWLQLSEKHLTDQNVDWEKAEAIIFNEWTNPDDEELGVQIVKDLHRTGCSLFCGEHEHNQALLKRVLLAYARWNKNVGYCQGFNMLAALILQVMDKDEKSAVKVMIYLIEGVLPESYFANNLRGLSVDMAVFRDLLRLRLPKLSKHLEALQNDTNSGTSYEPPLTNVFTMQWFLTLFSNCLPQQTVLRVWDLVFLYGNEVLLRTALAIWGILQDRVITVESADEFYSIMGVVTREMLEFGLMDANNLVKMIAMVDPFPNELQELREKYLYNISPWSPSVQYAARKGMKLFYSDPDDQDDTEDEDKFALTTAYGVFRSKRDSGNRELQVSGPTLDIGILKKQYAKLRERQRQAHVILTAACTSTLPGSITAGPSVSVNHLLMGKSALVNKGKRIGPPEGSVPPFRDKKVTLKSPVVTEESEESRQSSASEKKLAVFKNKSNNRETTFCISDRNRNCLSSEFQENSGRNNKVNASCKINYDSEDESYNKQTDDDDDDDDDHDDDDSESSSTELCDDQNFSDCDDTSQTCNSYLTESEQTDRKYAVLNLTGEEEERQLRDNPNCDQDNKPDLGQVADETMKETKEQNESSEKLEKEEESFDETEKTRKTCKATEIVISEMPLFPEKRQTESFDSNHAGSNSSLICLDESREENSYLTNLKNTIRLEPEVPIDEVDKPVGEKSRRKNVNLGLNVIRENSQMLHKFSQSAVTHKPYLKAQQPQHDDDDDEDEKQGGSFLFPEEKKICNQLTENESMKLHEVIHLENNEEKTDLHICAFFNPNDSTNVAKTITMRNTAAEEEEGKGESPKPEKVSTKEVNTEITGFQSSEVDISSGMSSVDEETTSSSGRKQLLTSSTFRGGRVPDLEGGSGYVERDEIEERIEVIKSDWKLKMKKIAELETTTREALSEMQVPRFREPKSPQRFAGSERNDVKGTKDYLDVDACFLDLPRENRRGRQKLNNSAASFDVITSRTEKLLGNVRFSRSTDESFYLQREFEYRKPKTFDRRQDKVSEVSEVSEVSASGDKDCVSRRSASCLFRRYEQDNNSGAYGIAKAGESRTDQHGQSGKTGVGNSGEGENRKCSATALHLSRKFETSSSSDAISTGGIAFNPFPTRIQSRYPKQVGVKLGLYPSLLEGQPKSNF